MSRVGIMEYLKSSRSDERFKHIMGVVSVAGQLARQEGYDQGRAELAGLLHDLAKGLATFQLKELLAQSGWVVDQIEMEVPELLHAPVGAYLALTKFGINDPEILEAIRYHTIGSPEMGLLARIIYIADYIEPNRSFPGLEEIRDLAGQGIEAALIAITGNIIKYNIERGRIVHPNTLLLRNSCLRRTT